MASRVVSLASIVRPKDLAKRRAEPAACGGGMDPATWDKVKDHPCYSEEAHHFYARMHVAVAPACNIQCNYCNRKYDCSNESRPGVVSEKLDPEQALRKVMAVAAKVPQLSVLGVAGPGDALANPHKTFRTFDLVARALPHIKLCLSTNGLALPDHVAAIRDHGVDHVTVTINAVDPEVAERIYPWIFFDHRRWTGREAARILLDRQMEGVAALVASGVLVKVNSVMIPGVNDDHLIEVNAAVKSAGVFLHNVMPLISDPAHGTRFGLDGQPGPTPAELSALQERLEGGAKLMRHCRQCRADAVGMLGEDRNEEFTLDRLDGEAAYHPEAREAYVAFVEREMEDRRMAEQTARQALPAGAETMLVAVATKGGGRINQHFGHAREFQIFEVDGAGCRPLGERRAENYCQGGFGEDERLEAVLAALDGVSAVLVARIGDCPRRRLAEAGIAVLDDFAYEYIEPSVMACFARMIAQRQGYDTLMASA
ncbi:MAG: nitrogenase cofactor biosynthesis protein NifB [Alphaproteobacteria bacterium]|nr:nitrogenase cofactor biosynthesis protein NifB [Alphaproteobacteria bacterium]